MAKVLIIRFSSIGDIVLTTPVVRNLAQQMHDGAEIHYLTKNRFKSILEPNPFIQKVYGIEKSTNEVVDQLKEERYDYIIDLHRNLRSARVKKALRMLSFSFRKLNWEKWLLVNFGINRMPDIHIVDRYMETLKIFKIENDNKGLDYFIPESEDLWPEFVPQHIRENYVALVISATHWRKKPRMNQYIRLCRETTKNIILLGGPSEQEEGKEISEKGGGHVLNAAGLTNLHQSAFLIKQAGLVVTPDTGMMHIASAFKKPIISFWGATVPDFGMYPYLNESLDLRIQADHLSKRPCSKLGTRCKYKPCKCIDELPLEKAVAEINSQKMP